jgi:hypothetical protein
MSRHPQELRNDICQTMTRCLTEIRRLEKRLSLKRYSRVYKKPDSKTAQKRDVDRIELEDLLVESQDELYEAFMRLPEVRQDETLHHYRWALKFAEQLAAKPRFHKYLIGQKALVS